MKPAQRAISVSAREWRRLLIGNWGKDGEPGGEPWFGEGTFVQHLTPGILTQVGFCGRPVSRISSQPIRTLIGITCPRCTSVLKRIVARVNADHDAKVDSTP